VWRKSEEPRSQSLAEISTTSKVSTSVISTAPIQEPPAPPVSPRAVACLSQGIRITGEVTGSEDLFVDGEVEGSIQIDNATLTVGPNGHLHGPIAAREIVVRGEVSGDLTATEKVHIWHTGQTLGDIRAKRIVIEDGADVRGRVETLRERRAARFDSEHLGTEGANGLVALSEMAS
jgi:cytoskeletal protein CcmA (bactofilin family)